MSWFLRKKILYDKDLIIYANYPLNGLHVLNILKCIKVVYDVNTIL